MLATVLSATIEFTDQAFIKPMVLSRGQINVITEARATVEVIVDGVCATGRGSIYLSDLWAWPEPTLTHDERDRIMRRVCECIAAELNQRDGAAPLHPTEIGIRLHDWVCGEDGEGIDFGWMGGRPSKLALAVCLSPFDAAIHDAVGSAGRRSALDLYDSSSPLPSLDRYFPGTTPGAAIRDLLAGSPRSTSPAWLIVGKNDDWDRDLLPMIRKSGYSHFKLKITGTDHRADLSRTIEVFKRAAEVGLSPVLSIDSNEANPDAESVERFLSDLRDADERAFGALSYVEQPTGRDIFKHRFDWRRVAKIKPVLLDEGLTGLDLMQEAKDQGWSGLAIKTCKGHSLALASAAWARQNGMILALQDLTNPGISAIHSAILARRIPTLNGVELNSPQYTPAANEAWISRLPGLFAPTTGTHQLPGEHVGLGSEL